MRAGASMTRRVALVFSLLMSIALIAPLPGLAAPGGNSANAKLCQKGGWTTLAPSGSSVGFASQDECVSYGAQGGEIAQLTGIVIPAGHSATISGFYFACNELAGSYTVSNGESGDLGSSWNPDCPKTDLFGPVTTSVFTSGVVLDFTLIDQWCGTTFDAYGDHALVSSTDAGYQLDMMDAGGCDSGARVPSEPGDGNFSVQIVIN